MEQNVLSHDDAIPRRAQAALEAARGHAPPQAWNWFKATLSGLGTVMACASEAFTLTVAVQAQWPELSTGENRGAQMMLMRYGLIAGLILTHAVVHENGERPNRLTRRILGKAKFLPILALVGGMATFMLIATASAAGGDDGQVNLSGWAIGAACAALFSISAMASNRLVGAFLTAMKAIVTARAARATTDDLAGEIAIADALRRSIESQRTIVTALEQPDALKRRAATTAGRIAGNVTAQAHEACASRRAHEGMVLTDEDEAPFRDVPLDALERLLAELSRYDFAHFLALLKMEN